MSTPVRSLRNGRPEVALDLVDYETLTREAVKVFWGGRSSALTKNAAGERADAGSRGAVTGGKHLDGFVELMKVLSS